MLENLDYAHDAALAAHTHHHVHEKTGDLDTVSREVRLNVTFGKSL